jgi:methionyl-tRNA formyltransferase
LTNTGLRIVFLGSPPFATPVFERLVASQHRPLALVTRPDRPRGRGRALERSPLVVSAERAGIEVLQPSDPHAPEVVERLRALAPDALFVASYGAILKPPLLTLAPLGAFNAHASLLPRHRGASPIQAALLAGDAVTGVSIQRIVAELDAGDVLLSRERPIGPRDTAGDLLEALAELAGAAAVDALDQLADGRARFEPQDPSRVTVARKLTKAHGRIDWGKGAWELERFVRAMNPWPAARCTDPGGRELTVLGARVYDEGEAKLAQAGELVAANGRLVVACGRGLLEVLQVAPAGKRAMSGADFLRGARLEPGQRLGTPGE